MQSALLFTHNSEEGTDRFMPLSRALAICKVKCKPPHLGFELRLLFPFLTMITLSTPSGQHKCNEEEKKKGS